MARSYHEAGLGTNPTLCYTGRVRELMDRIARFFDAEYAGYSDDIPVIEAFAQRTGGPVLELGCGTGRVLIPLARAGYTVTGVDLSPEMLRIARAKAEAADVSDRITLVEGDFGDAPLAGPYRLAFVVMNTFMHLPSQADQLRALRHWRAHLAPGALLILDVIHPDVAQLANLDGRLEWVKTWRDPHTDATVIKWMSRTVELDRQMLHLALIYEEVAPDGTSRRTVATFDLRYLWRYEAELLLDKAGFALEEVYGDWDLSPFEGHSERMILVGRRRR